MAKKGKGKDKKGKKGKEVEKVEIKEEKKEEKIFIPEPCIFSCAQEQVTYRPNSYPGVLEQPKTMAVVGSETGSYDSLCKLLHSGFRCADRVYAMVPWGNYVVFRAPQVIKSPPTDPNAKDDKKKLEEKKDEQDVKILMIYFLFDGCTCNVNRFRYLDLSCGTAGLLYFEEMHKMVNYIIMSRSRRDQIKNLKRCVVDDVCKEMYGSNHI